MLATYKIRQYGRASLLELILLLLPRAIALDSNPNTTENHLFAATEINSQLHNVAVFNRV
jgi:hypothetical protein